jgi:phage/plasmid-associated DNA primase
LSLFGNKKQSFFINTGKGGNGKGLFSNILEKSLGDYFLEVQHTFLTSKKEDNKANSDLYKAKGVRVVNVTEPEGCNITDEIQLNTEFVKKITGGDTVVARDLYKSTISYKPQFTPFLQCNNMPKMKRVEGMERRTSVIPWKFNFVSGKPNIKLFQKKRDTTLVDKFNRILEYSQFQNF